MQCIKCSISDNEAVIYCDGRKRPVQSRCSDLSSSELRVMDLKGKRSLKFYCEDCLQGVRLVPTLINKIEEMSKEIIELKALKTELSTTLEEKKMKIHVLVGENLTLEKTGRMGKKNKNGARALRLTFSNKEDAQKVIRARRDEIKKKKIFVSADLTPHQIQHLKSIKEELTLRREKGEVYS